MKLMLCCRAPLCCMSATLCTTSPQQAAARLQCTRASLLQAALKGTLCAGANHTRARELWQQAAKLDVSEASYLLGRAHELGRGVPRDLRAAAELYLQGWEAAMDEAQAVALLLAWMAVSGKLGLARLGRMPGLHLLGRAVLRPGLRTLAWLDAWGWRTLGTLCVGLVGVLWLRAARRRRLLRQPC